MSTFAFKKRKVISWALYDWAMSAFSTIVTTFIFAAYFTRKVAVNEIIGTQQWGYAMAFAGVIIVILSPIFGAIADNSGRRKIWLAMFTLLAMIGAALLWFAKPDPSYVHITLLAVIIGTIGIEISQVFYNGFLPQIVPISYLGRMSGWGWSTGYAGGLVALVIALFVFVESPPHWLNSSNFEHIRICGPFVAVWLGIFTIPLFLLIPEHPNLQVSTSQAISRGLKTFWGTLKTLPKQKNILLFLIARMIYTDGLNTIFAFGGIYAAGTFGMSITQVIKFGIVLNVAAGIGAASLAWLDDWIGSKWTIGISIIGLLTLGIGIVVAHSVILFWILSFLLCLFVGPVQAASRSMLARISPPEKINEMFGLYTFSGKATAYIGPWLLGTVTLYAQSQRAGIASVLIFFIIGGLLLIGVHETRGKLTSD